MQPRAHCQSQRVTRPCGAQKGLDSDVEDGVGFIALLLRLAGGVWSGRIRFRSPLSPRTTGYFLGSGGADLGPWASWKAGREHAGQRHAALDAAMSRKHRHPMDWADYTFNAVRCRLETVCVTARPTSSIVHVPLQCLCRSSHVCVTNMLKLQRSLG